jgi:hypothetical protein
MYAVPRFVPTGQVACQVWLLIKDQNAWRLSRTRLVYRQIEIADLAVFTKDLVEMVFVNVLGQSLNDNLWEGKLAIDQSATREYS